MYSQFVAYFRVSTAEQEGSGLGIEAQQEKVRQLVAAKGGELIAEFTEVESGRKTNRPVLAECLAAARKLHTTAFLAGSSLTCQTLVQRMLPVG